LQIVKAGLKRGFRLVQFAYAGNVFLSLLDCPLNFFLLKAEVVKALLLQRGLLWLRLSWWCLLDHNLILVSLQRVGLRHILVNKYALRVISSEVLFGPFITK
jgi:hypothetical protein